MSISLVVNGTTFQYPQPGDTNWGSEATGWASAVTSGMLQKAGGTFTLTAEVDFGASFGLKSLYYKSRSSNIAAAGVVRLAVGDVMSWRNNANSADLALSVNGSDALLFNGVQLATTGDLSGYQPLNSLLTAISGLGANGLIVRTSSSTSSARTLTGTANRITISNGDGVSGNPTFDIGTDVVTLTDTQTLTNKTISGASNTITNVSLTSGVTGTLPIANGGTGQTAKTAAFNALSPITTKGDIITSNGTDNVRLGVGTDGYIIVADSGQTTGLNWIPNPSASQATASTLGVVKGGTVPGDTSGGSIAAGYLGERISSEQQNIGGINTGGYSTVQQITVSAGCWDLSCVVYIPSTASLTGVNFGVATADNTNTGHVLGSTATGAATISGQDTGGCLAGIRKEVSGSTTYYLTVRPFGANITGGFGCRITAVRVG